ncbi:Secreted protein [Pseudomonas sp. PM2]
MVARENADDNAGILVLRGALWFFASKLASTEAGRHIVKSFLSYKICMKTQQALGSVLDS